MSSVTTKTRNVVYALHGGDGILRYVGSTTKTAQRRLWEHVYRARSNHQSQVYKWMREVGPDSVVAVVIAVPADPADLLALEARMILRMVESGIDLANETSRDGVINSMSQASRDRMGASKKGRETWIKGKTGVEAGWSDERRATFGQEVAARAASKRALLPPKTPFVRPVAPHGTTGKYKSFGCRCDLCRTAMSDYKKLLWANGRIGARKQGAQ